jgi:hypothetical protein
MQGSPKLSPRKAAARAARDERLARALRDNLRRRKEQARAQAAPPDTAADPGSILSAAPVSRKSKPGGGTAAE